jgi:hypothetical protein
MVSQIFLGVITQKNNSIVAAFSMFNVYQAALNVDGRTGQVRHLFHPQAATEH